MTSQAYIRSIHYEITFKDQNVHYKPRNGNKHLSKIKKIVLLLKRDVINLRDNVINLRDNVIIPIYD